MTALAVYRDGVCPGCGLHREILDHPDDHLFTLEDKHCKVCASIGVHDRVRRDREQRATNDKAPPHAPRPGDGVHTYLRPLTADEIATARRGDGNGRQPRG